MRDRNRANMCRFIGNACYTLDMHVEDLSAEHGGDFLLRSQEVIFCSGKSGRSLEGFLLDTWFVPTLLLSVNSSGMDDFCLCRSWEVHDPAEGLWTPEHKAPVEEELRNTKVSSFVKTSRRESESETTHNVKKTVEQHLVCLCSVV